MLDLHNDFQVLNNQSAIYMSAHGLWKTQYLNKK